MCLRVCIYTGLSGTASRAPTNSSHDEGKRQIWKEKQGRRPDPRPSRAGAFFRLRHGYAGSAVLLSLEVRIGVRPTKAHPMVKTGVRLVTASLQFFLLASLPPSHATGTLLTHGDSVAAALAVRPPSGLRGSRGTASIGLEG